MDQYGIGERPGLHFEHLRQLVRLRRASGWLGIIALVGLLALRGMDKVDPDLFRAAAHERQESSTQQVDHPKTTTAIHEMRKVTRS